MIKRTPSLLAIPQPSRRRFVHGLAVGGGMLSLAEFGRKAVAAGLAAPSTGAPVLRGRDFNLEVMETPVNFTGSARMATAINGSIPAPTLRWREGDEVTIRVTNRLREATSIHWHGIILPYQMDGVPGISFKPVSHREIPSPTGSRSSKAAPTGTTRTPACRRSPACTVPSSSSRAAAKPSRPTATTWCCCRTGPTKTRCGFSPSSRPRATTTTTTSQRPWTSSRKRRATASSRH